MEMKVKPLMRVSHADQVKSEYEGRSGDTRNLHDDEMNEEAWDDVSGACLDAGEVRKARAKEIGYVRQKKVWIKITRKEAIRRGIKIIKTLWIDINKGDVLNPIYRSRFVGKEFNDGTVDGLFAATPPLEALRLLVSEAATVGDHDKVIMLNDIARAFFGAPMKRLLCIELPAEDMEEGDEDMVGLLQMSLYGTRDAALNFQQEVKKFMVSNGFIQGMYNPCTYFHKQKGLRTLVHGDDFVTTGDEGACSWFKKALERRFEIKTVVIGAGEDHVKEARILNRIVRATQAGWEYEPDSRHAEILIKELNLVGAKGVSSPTEEEKMHELEANEEVMDAKDHRGFRALAARANYLAQDRSDLQYAVKEVCRGMATPTKGHMKKLRRLGRYLVSHPRVVTMYRWQEQQEILKGYSDSDWAGCRRTAKSTSGGVVMRGRHYLRSWSSTQKCVSLSSGEAELVAVVKVSCELIGMSQLLHDWGYNVHGEVLVDSSAALGIVKRKGNGKMRHVRVGMLWVQEAAEEGHLKYTKVLGTQNPADLMTKVLSYTVIDKHMMYIAQETRTGAAEAGLIVV